MSGSEVVEIIGYLIGAYALGWCGGHIHLYFKKLTEVIT